MGVVLGASGSALISFYDTTGDAFYNANIEISSTSGYTGDSPLLFSEPNCAGRVLGIANNYHRYAYACTGSATCTKRPVYSVNAQTGTVSYQSYRTAAGQCYGSTSGSTNPYKIYYICGEGLCTMQ